MAVHNGQRFLGQAIESILSQSFRNLELIVINDNSTDRTRHIIEEYCDQDSRVILINNLENYGPFVSANFGLKVAKGIYIARMDADDISHPTRFEKQINFMESHEEIGLLGTNGYYIDENGKKLGPLPHYANDLDIRWGALFDSQFLHSSIIFRRSLLLKVGGYEEEYKYAQDYELYSRLLNHTKGANLKERLVYWRRTSDNITSQKKEEQLKFATQIAINNINQLFGHSFVSSHDEILFFRGLSQGRYKKAQEEPIRRYLQILDKFIDKHNMSLFTKKRFITSIAAKLFDSIYRRGINDSNLKFLTMIMRLSPFALLIGLRNMLLRTIRKRFAHSK